jgi:hypothetical protein
LIPGCTLRRQPKRLAKACEKAGAELVAVDSNPVDAVWTDRPAPPLGPVKIHPAQLAGESEATSSRASALKSSN